MESGTIAGVVTGACMLVAQVFVTRYSLTHSTSWTDFFQHIVVTTAVLGAIDAISVGFLYAFNVSDSSHGFVSIIMPIIVAFLCLIASSISVAIRVANVE